MTQQETEQKTSNWKMQVYVIGTAIGTLLGFFSAYLFAQEAEDNAEGDEQPDIPASAMLGLALSVITVVRQIAETPRKKKDKKK
ncbi:MAG: hypothetical protein AAFR81_06755 [Chloroflexota bacterium]